MGAKQSAAGAGGGRGRGSPEAASSASSEAALPGPGLGASRGLPSALGLRSRSVSSVVSGVGLLEGGSANASLPFGLYAAGAASSSSSSAAAAAAPSSTTTAAPAEMLLRGTGPDSAPFAPGNGFQDNGGGGGGGTQRDPGGGGGGGMLYLGPRASALADALPIHLTAPRWFSAHSGFKCPICSKSVASDEMEMHFIMCLSKPRLSYNDDVLTKDAGECVICLEELLQGDTIARLPCLCIYHKSCIDSWFEVNRSCPEHPSD
ncbi:E3 ubiquitin-protein ligase ZNRF1 [Sceloporus undulatus]|uniref:E3 ubiquitin-protein ligase ZNRF1 n=1 Tax=Sceloporus undulatus TaxID=8520 RepID=UPI001C4B0C13|nr:E3 ubiquitin-protein ligase ZNRF1 [Sceloporus undulatus]